LSAAEKKTPEQVLAELVAMFPSFQGYALDNETSSDTLTVHRVMSLFTDFFIGAHSTYSDWQLIKFGSWINEVVQVDDELENAVSTCFLEHTRQIGVAKALAPHLSKLAKQRSRA
jgi:hypothetical protein